MFTSYGAETWRKKVNTGLIVRTFEKCLNAHQVFALSDKMRIKLFSVSMLLPHPHLMYLNAPKSKEQRSGNI